ncbi:MAG TPA: hypothetical protein VGZ22_24685, partial [Isosphaeraceae bacterium]|nr:hypothetical protein [Isosphaeraceae bacterium]
RLDPGRVAAWKKLGFKRHNGRWMSEDQLKEEAELIEADHIWAPLLGRWHRMYHDRNKQADAEEALSKIEDPKAVPSIFREFATGGRLDQTLAIQLFGQMKDPLASKALAALAVYGATPEVRRRATESLRAREPAEFIEAIVKLLVDPLKYEVRHVGGPGSPGILFVEGERFNLKRFYAPPPPPNLVMHAGDQIAYDQFGLPVVIRYGASVSGAPSVPLPTAGAPGGGFSGANLTIPPGSPLAGALKSTLAGESVPPAARPGAGAGSSLVATPTYAMEFSVSQNIMQAQAAAAAAQAQLQNDVAMVESLNKVRKAFNELVIDVIKNATGQDAGGDKASDWKNWFANQKGYAKEPARKPQKPTLNQLVPLAYNPSFSQLMILPRIGPPDN